jgi:hypothetical protein
MLKITAIDETTVPGVTIYGDDEQPWVFYVLASQPTFRLDQNGHPVFRFIKYRLPLDRPDGKKGGALVAFDVEFAVANADLDKIRKAKQSEVNAMFGGQAPAVQIGSPIWTKGTATLNMIQDNVLVEGIKNPASPSLYGRNITPFFLELTPEGASVFESALQGLGGFVQVSYQLTAAVGCPVDAFAHYDASKSYDFVQHYVSGKHWYGDDKQINDITEQWHTYGAETINANFPPGTPDQLKAQVMDHLYKFLDGVVSGNPLGDIAPADRSTGDQDIDRHFTITKTEDFDYNFHENQAIDWSFNPQGTLPNITTIPGVKWSDYASEVDPANDPFFQSIHVDLRVDADWGNLPVDSVDVTIDYGKNMGHAWHFQTANDVLHFDAYTSDNNGSRKYKYRYIVNYKDESKTFNAQDVETDSESLTITVGELGIFDATVQAGAINFDQVPQAEVTLHYEDPDNNVDPFEEVIVLDKDHHSVRYQKVIFAPRIKPFKYTVKYITAAGPQYTIGPVDNLAEQVFIDGPFTNTQTINVRALGSFDTMIDSIFLDMTYTDERNSYTLQKSVALSKSNPFFDWSFGVIDIDGGQVTYSGTIKYKDGTSEDIAQQALPAGRRTIEIGKVGAVLKLVPIPDLIDWTAVKLAKVDAHYVDAANKIDKSYEWILRPNAGPPQEYDQSLTDPAQNSFTWTATFYMATTPPTEQVIPLQTATDGSFVVDPSLAVAPVPH